MSAEKMLFYESFADEFDSKMNMYDTTKRVNVVFDELLNGVDLTNKKLLDAGCGTGWFSQRAVERGAEVYSLDMGEKLLAKVAEKCESKRIVGSILELPFEDNTFDFVVSSEVIEHVTHPFKALQEMNRVLKSGGTLVVTTPNQFWYFSLWIANKFNLRPYQGLENWYSRKQLKKDIKSLNLTIEDFVGIHLFPFIVPALNPVLDFFHRYKKSLAPFMVNIALKATKVK